MSKLKIGDWVRVYGADGPGLFDDVMVIIAIISDSFLQGRQVSDPPDGRVLTFHKKQCRKLVPKKPRRRIWVNEYSEGFTAPHSSFEEAEKHRVTYLNHCIRTVEFVEVRKKK